MSRLITDVGLAPITASLVASSILLFGNGVLELGGPVPLIRDKLGPLDLRPKDKVRIWAAYFRRVGVLVVGSAITNSVFCIFTAIKTVNPVIRRYAVISAVGSNIIIPYTLLVLMKTNTSLLALDKEAEKRVLTESEEKEGENLIDKWAVLHRPRFVGFVAAWTGSLLAFVTAVQGFKL